MSKQGKAAEGSHKQVYIADNASMNSFVLGFLGDVIILRPENLKGRDFDSFFIVYC